MDEAGLAKQSKGDLRPQVDNGMAENEPEWQERLFGARKNLTHHPAGGIHRWSRWSSSLGLGTEALGSGLGRFGHWRCHWHWHGHGSWCGWLGASADQP